MEKESIAVVMTVFNRIDKTRKCIDSILNELNISNISLDFYITNDGSTDNTIEVLESYKNTYKNVGFFVFEGNGSLYWNKGMYLAYGEALKNKYDYFLWVNNDVVFNEGFLSQIIEDSKKAKGLNEYILICGAVTDSTGKHFTYGGSINLSKKDPYNRRIVIPDGSIQRCDCINGNCVLIPYDTAQKIGNLEYRYEHGCGDFDYGYKLLACGGQPYASSNYVGICNRNPIAGSWKDDSISIIERIKKKNAPTGLPAKSQYIYLRKWFPKHALYYVIKPYFGIVIGSVKYRLRNRK